jgi:tRNA pseudouridine55 synthase
VIKPRRAPRAATLQLDGVVNLNKPLGLTSARALDQVRLVTRQRKSGHGGTLDPLATGVMLICLGRSTKLVEAVMDQPKTYRATARLDVTSEGYDLEVEPVPVEVRHVPRPDEVAERMAAFEGLIEQAPPERSAVKVGGVAAYKLHARGAALRLRPRTVRIDWICVHRYAWPVIEFEVCCGRGMYVRSLIRDLGHSLGVGGCLTALERTSIGPFTVDDALTVESLRARRDTLDFVIPHDRARALFDGGRGVVPPRPCPPIPVVR